MTAPISGQLDGIESSADRPRKRIYFVWTYSGWGGAQIYTLAIVKAAVNDRDITILMPKGSSDEIAAMFRAEGTDVEYLRNSIVETPVSGLLGKIGRQAARIRSEIEVYSRLIRIADRRNSVVHLETAPWQSWILITALTGSGLKVFLTLHNAIPRASRLRELIWRLRLRFVSSLPRFGMFTANEDAKDKLKGWVNEQFWDRIKVTYAGIDPGQIRSVADKGIDRDGLLDRFGISPEKEIILCVGQFIDRKGRWTFLEAAEKIIPVRDAEFVWVMPELPTGDDLEKVTSFSTHGRFHMIRSRDIGAAREDILSFIRSADIFVLPSDLEGLPIALLEAMALGIPAISTNVNGIPEAVKNEETGLLIEPRNASALASAIVRLLDDEMLRARLSEAGRRHVIESFDQWISAKTAIAAYDEETAES